MCDKPGKWELFSDFNNMTFACDEHLGLMLTDDFRHTVYRAEKGESDCRYGRKREDVC